MPSVSSQPSSGRGDERNKVSLFSKRSLKMLALFSQWEEQFEGKANYNCFREDLPDTYCLNLCCIGIRFCWQPFCSLHLHLEMSENPYTSGPITSKKSVPGIIVATGRVTWRTCIWFVNEADQIILDISGEALLIFHHHRHPPLSQINAL